jgi:hypothetical protein
MDLDGDKGVADRERTGREELLSFPVHAVAQPLLPLGRLSVTQQLKSFHDNKGITVIVEVPDRKCGHGSKETSEKEGGQENSTGAGSSARTGAAQGNGSSGCGGSSR